MELKIALLQLGFKSDLIDYSDIQDFNDLYDYELVFIALHGFEGENGELQARLDKMNIIFTGSNLQPAAIHGIKIYVKQF